MGNNQVAFDAVCCAIIGVDPRTVDHIRLASERGFGTMDLSQIEITGDVTLDEAQERAKGFEVGLIRVEKYFEGTQHHGLRRARRRRPSTPTTAGAAARARSRRRSRSCGTYDKECDKKMPRLHVVFGAYEGPIDAKPGEKVVFIGDCAKWEGKIGDELVSIESLYKDRSTKDPHEAEARRHLRQDR